MSKEKPTTLQEQSGGEERQDQFEHLPDDVLSEIGKHLNEKDLLHLSRTQQRTREIFRSDLNKITVTKLVKALEEVNQAKRRPAPVLAALSELKREILAEILKVSTGRLNALMLAAQFQPTAVAPIIAAISTLDPSTQTKILKKTDWVGRNALMLAVENNPQVVEPILAAIRTLAPHDRADILTQERNDGNTALMLAVENNPQVVEPILVAIGTLAPQDRANILTQERNDENTALLLAALDAPEAVKLLLDEIRTLEPKIQAKILSKTDRFNCNALRLAVESQDFPPLAARLAVVSLITAIGELDTDAKAEIIKNTRLAGDNLLLWAAGRTLSQPGAVPAVFKAISGLPAKDQSEMLKETNDWGNNALMQAIISNPVATASILSAMLQLDPKSREDILKQKANDGHDAFSLAKKYSPDIIPLMEVTRKFEGDEKTRKELEAILITNPKLLAQIPEVKGSRTLLDSLATQTYVDKQTKINLALIKFVDALSLDDNEKINKTFQTLITIANTHRSKFGSHSGLTASCKDLINKLAKMQVEEKEKLKSALDLNVKDVSSKQFQTALEQYVKEGKMADGKDDSRQPLLKK
ncbi:Ankyrin repeats (3 copies) (plasmid) [Legionella adelaidensis]|uniref:Ankyrin repeats (3 copies) n=1 Tax=Legionella adelaidensis TaxID=45056 RepID=A0A0W0R4K1_9GAMM|nr:ankyrin repeat domain-containing protein [Legionella adelaidensis]KTC66000.1 Ankyrin repeats (3 copies) [Legionella adelaidensis]VEH86324.1 Ankyrin repeats (3 copies) [Legionella adelaidensis]